MFASRFLATFETQAGLEERGLIPGTPCLSIIPTLGPNAYEQYLHWAFWSPRALGDAGTSRGVSGAGCMALCDQMHMVTT